MAPRSVPAFGLKCSTSYKCKVKLEVIFPAGTARERFGWAVR